MIVRILDTETTGRETFDEVVEIAAVDIDLSEPRVTGAFSQLVRPTYPIPPEAMGIHHITNEMVEDAQPWEATWPYYLDAYRWQGVDLFVAHKADFEGARISDEKRGGRPLICTYRAALRVFPDAPGFSNQTLRYWLKLPVGGEGFPPHRALPDAWVTAYLFDRLVMRASIDDMIAWSAEPPVLPRIGFGKHRGSRWSDLPADYLEWMTNPSKNDLDEDARWNARRELARRYAARAGDALAETFDIRDMRFWFAGEKARREALGIVEGTDFYGQIVDACNARKAEMVCDLPRPAGVAA